MAGDERYPGERGTSSSSGSSSASRPRWALRLRRGAAGQAGQPRLERCSGREGGRNALCHAVRGRAAVGRATVGPLGPAPAALPVPQVGGAHAAALLELDLEVLAAVRVPEVVAALGRVAHAHEQRLLLDARHQVLQLDQEDESVKRAALDRLVERRRRLGRRRPVVKREADDDALGERQVAHVDDAAQVPRVLGQGDALQVDVGVERHLRREVGQPEGKRGQRRSAAASKGRMRARTHLISRLRRAISSSSLVLGNG